MRKGLNIMKKWNNFGLVCKKLIKCKSI